MSKTTIPTGGITDAAVTTAKITDANISTAKLADDAVTDAKLGTLTQITFNATQSASTNANTLDDYEEGTWTPTFGNYSGTETIAGARYTKIGRMVYAGCKIETDGTSDSSNVQIDGFPFTVVNTTNGASGAGIVAYTTGNAAQRWRAGSNEARFYVYDNTGSNLNYNDLGANKIFELNFIYEAA